jgi:hypothetical protein
MMSPRLLLEAFGVPAIGNGDRIPALLEKDLGGLVQMTMLS